MGFGGLNLWKLAIVLLIIVLIFGTKRIKSIASDLAGAVKGFRNAVADDERRPPPPRQIENAEPDAEFPEQKDRSGRG